MKNAILVIQYDDSLLTIRQQLLYTMSRLHADDDAKDLEPAAKGLLEQWAGLSASQLAVWDAEVIAQATVDACDDDLDETVDSVDDALQDVSPEKRRSARYTRYVKSTKGEITRLGLETELDRVRTWPASLKTEPEAELQALGQKLEDHVAKGDSAVEGRALCTAQTADHRVRQIVRFVDDVNGMRRSLFGALITRGETLKKTPSWPYRFFRKSKE